MKGRKVSVMVLTAIALLFLGINAIEELAVILITAISYFIFKDEIAEVK